MAREAVVRILSFPLCMKRRMFGHPETWLLRPLPLLLFSHSLPLLLL